MNVSIRIYSFLLVNKHTKFEDRSFIPIHILLFSALAILLQLIQLSSTAEQATLHTQVSLLPTARQLRTSAQQETQHDQFQYQYFSSLGRCLICTPSPFGRYLICAPSPFGRYLICTPSPFGRGLGWGHQSKENLM